MTDVPSGISLNPFKEIKKILLLLLLLPALLLLILLLPPPPLQLIHFILIAVRSSNEAEIRL
jgi:hypothetical protein